MRVTAGSVTVWTLPSPSPRHLQPSSTPFSLSRNPSDWQHRHVVRHTGRAGLTSLRVGVAQRVWHSGDMRSTISCIRIEI